jgi:hypothetical protein
VTSMGQSAFYGCSALASVTIGNSVTSISDSAFISCTSLTSITIPNSVTSIGFFAFNYCTSLTSITIPDSVTSIGDSVFQNCSALTSIIIPSSLTSIGQQAFYGCSALASITIPDSVTSLGQSAFSFCTSLTSITIPDSVTSLGPNAFNNCSKLTNVIIGNSITSIGESAFQGCTTLTSITFFSNLLPIIGNNCFPTVSTLYVQYGTDTTSIQQYSQNISILPEPTPIITPPITGPIITPPIVPPIITPPIVPPTITPPNIISNTCFPAGTLIVTNQGNIPIEKINPFIHTIRNKQIMCITKTITEDKHLVCFEKDSLSSNIPSEKTIISQNHVIFYKGNVMRAIHFVEKFKNVYKIKYTGEILYNVLMEQYDKMMVNNLICETLHPENNVAKLYKMFQIYKVFQKLTPSVYEELIKKFNKCSKQTDVVKSMQTRK